MWSGVAEGTEEVEVPAEATRSHKKQPEAPSEQQKGHRERRDTCRLNTAARARARRRGRGGSSGRGVHLAPVGGDEGGKRGIGWRGGAFDEDVTAKHVGGSRVLEAHLCVNDRGGEGAAVNESRASPRRRGARACPNTACACSGSGGGKGIQTWRAHARALEAGKAFKHGARMLGLWGRERHSGGLSP